MFENRKDEVAVNNLFYNKYNQEIDSNHSLNKKRKRIVFTSSDSSTSENGREKSIENNCPISENYHTNFFIIKKNYKLNKNKFIQKNKKGKTFSNIDLEEKTTSLNIINNNKLYKNISDDQILFNKNKIKTDFSLSENKKFQSQTSSQKQNIPINNEYDFIDIYELLEVDSDFIINNNIYEPK